MRTTLALLFALTTSSLALADEAKPRPAAPAKTIKAKATTASVTALRDRFAKARDELRAFIAKPIPKLTNAEMKTYDALAKDAREMADLADAAARTITEELSKASPALDRMSELGEQQQLKVQVVMDRMNKADTASSNTLKKMSDVLNQIIQNMK